MTEEQTHPIHLEKAELIISFANRKNGAFKAMMHYLREIEDQIQARQKKNRLFYQVVYAVEDTYQHKIYSARQLLHRIATELRHIDYDIDKLAMDRETLKQELEQHEIELNNVRQYAEQRRNKKSKRERQYHQLYHVPLVASQFKKKYVRARDKNLDAEEKVSEIRSIVDSCQKAIAELSKSITDCQKRRQELTLEQQDTHAEIKQIDDLLFDLDEGRKFWSGFDQHQLVTASKATTQFVEAIQQHAKNYNTFHRIMDPNQHFVKVFKLALYEYGEAERHAESRWGQLEVDFECAKCRTSQKGWPKPDKVRSMDLLCNSCYQEHHSSMVWEKRMSGVKDRSQQLLSLPGGSMLSFSSSSSTIASTDTNETKSKPGFKKVFKMLKTTKRNSSQTTLESNMMMA
ncbi:uncharacterized protein B0P05DRAFT_489165 [Gilbertella persicaria]|uniref:uncharacterized protein n=1 Tax=Gilbertella persicaria TaxID=101096 RepID=UPI00221EEC69|nr:uncharacterized protein B0P05DRAFT_489165 [Gilbertella persicaria]KAI8083409.1 hypothetical protein B0P05DRAFT_489165 [Gilbertella persicaria]